MPSSGVCGEEQMAGVTVLELRAMARVRGAPASCNMNALHADRKRYVTSFALCAIHVHATRTKGWHFTMWSFHAAQEAGRALCKTCPHTGAHRGGVQGLTVGACSCSGTTFAEHGR